jgi:DNA-binding response OmpR family regulator
MSAKRILIIDDDPDLVSALEVVLNGEGYETAAAYGGREGLAKALEAPPDLVILDVMMEDTDGFEVARQLKDDTTLAQVPVIMLTAVGEQTNQTSYSTAQALKSLEAEEWLDKPVDPQALLARIKELL